MKKKIILFSVALAMTLILSVCFAFATAECEHQFTDDGDCTTATVCSLCGESYVQSEHKFDTVISYSLEDDSIILGGTKTVKCSNSGCNVKQSFEVDPFVQALGYSVKNNNDQQRERSTLISSYIINASELDSYANTNEKEIEYGVICYIPEMLGKSVPLKANGVAASNAIKVKLNGVDGVSDLAVPKIPKASYDQKIVYAFYLIMDETVYYVQSDKILTDYNELVAVSCNDVYEKLNG